jgi:hypothetical protein
MEIVTLIKCMCFYVLSHKWLIADWQMGAGGTLMCVAIFLVYWQLFIKNYHGRWNMVLSVWFQKQIIKFDMETVYIPTTHASSHVEITNEDYVHHFLRYQGYYSIWIHSTRLNSQPSLLCGNTKAVTWSCAQMKAWTLVQQLDSSPWQCSSSQGTLCQMVSVPKINYWNGTPILFPWFGSEWLLAVSKNKVSLKEMKISENWRHKKRAIIILKDVPQEEFQKYFQQQQHCWAKCIAAQGEYFKCDISQ